MPLTIEQLELAMVTALRFNAAARCAVSAALHDLQGKRLGVPLWKLWGLDTGRLAAQQLHHRDRPRRRHAARARARRARPATRSSRSSWAATATGGSCELVREEAPNAILRVDANAAWTPKHTLSMAPMLRELGVEFVEQPLPPHDIDGLRFVRERCDLPIVADESCLVATDIPKLVGVVDGVNIKLAKCGSLREALRMIATARAHGMLVMAAA